MVERSKGTTSCDGAWEPQLPVSSYMTQTENGTTNPNPPPYDGVTSWSESTHILIDMTTFLFSN